MNLLLSSEISSNFFLKKTSNKLFDVLINSFILFSDFSLIEFDI
jgi:hypothetical protein